MKILEVITLLCFTATTANAQLKDNRSDFQESLAGRWQLMNEKPGPGSRSIHFYSDGIINLDDVNTKQVQGYEVSKSANGYKVNILALISRKYLSTFNILSLGNDDLEITYGSDDKLFYAKLKRVGDSR
jgi:hypothetical protein